MKTSIGWRDTSNQNLPVRERAQVEERSVPHLEDGVYSRAGRRMRTPSQRSESGTIIKIERGSRG
jgi:hypothetical protein